MNKISKKIRNKHNNRNTKTQKQKQSGGSLTEVRPPYPDIGSPVTGTPHDKDYLDVDPDSDENTTIKNNINKFLELKTQKISNSKRNIILNIYDLRFIILIYWLCDLSFNNESTSSNLNSPENLIKMKFTDFKNYVNKNIEKFKIGLNINEDDSIKIISPFFFSLKTREWFKNNKNFLIQSGILYDENYNLFIKNLELCFDLNKTNFDLKEPPYENKTNYKYIREKIELYNFLIPGKYFQIKSNKIQYTHFNYSSGEDRYTTQNKTKTMRQTKTKTKKITK